MSLPQQQGQLKTTITATLDIKRQHAREIDSASRLAIQKNRRLLPPMKFEQGQVWKTNPEVHSNEGKPIYLRIVELERMAVEYKEMADPRTRDGKHKTATKKEFCRLIKGGELTEY